MNAIEPRAKIQPPPSSLARCVLDSLALASVSVSMRRVTSWRTSRFKAIPISRVFAGPVFHFCRGSPARIIRSPRIDRVFSRSLGTVYGRGNITHENPTSAVESGPVSKRSFCVSRWHLGPLRCHWSQRHGAARTRYANHRQRLSLA